MLRLRTSSGGRRAPSRATALPSPGTCRGRRAAGRLVEPVTSGQPARTSARGAGTAPGASMPGITAGVEWSPATMSTSGLQVVQRFEQRVELLQRRDLRLEVAVLAGGVGALEVDEEEVEVVPVLAQRRDLVGEASRPSSAPSMPTSFARPRYIGYTAMAAARNLQVSGIDGIVGCLAKPRSVSTFAGRLSRSSFCACADEVVDQLRRRLGLRRERAHRQRRHALRAAGRSPSRGPTAPRLAAPARSGARAPARRTPATPGSLICAQLLAQPRRSAPSRCGRRAGR